MPLPLQSTSAQLRPLKPFSQQHLPSLKEPWPLQSWLEQSFPFHPSEQVQPWTPQMPFWLQEEKERER